MGNVHFLRRSTVVQLINKKGEKQVQLNIRLTGSALLALALLGAAAWHWKPWQEGQNGTKVDTSVLTPETPIVMPTNGGQLAVAIVTAKERFTRETSRVIFGQEIPVGRTKSHVQASVTYRYHIEMEKQWPLEIRGKVCIVRTPAIKPTLPVAFDTATVEKYTESGWARFDKNENLKELESTITGQLQSRAVSPQYDQIVKDASRETVKAFVSTWLLSQRRWGKEPEYRIVVLFPGESRADQESAKSPSAPQ